MSQVVLPSNVTVYSGRGKYANKVPSHLAPDSKIIDNAKEKLKISERNNQKAKEDAKKRSAARVKLQNKKESEKIALQNRPAIKPEKKPATTPDNIPGGNANIGGNKK